MFLLTILGIPLLHPPESVEVWRENHKLSGIKIDLEKLWESFHTSTHAYFFGRKDAARYVGLRPLTPMCIQAVFVFRKGS